MLPRLSDALRDQFGSDERPRCIVDRDDGAVRGFEAEAHGLLARLAAGDDRFDLR